MGFLEWWELASYVVTVVGLPFALIVYMLDQRKERQNEEEEIFQRLSDEYSNFLKLLLENADLRLTQPDGISESSLTDEQMERKRLIFDLLVSLFERAFILVYEDEMNPQTKRLWFTWEDYIRSWCRRRDFRDALGDLLGGEDPDFVAYMKKIAAQEEGRDSAARS